jgi:hypothetical protein
MKLLIVAVLALLVSGCNVPSYEYDETLRREVFKECVQSLPAGPNSTVYNDWDEVVFECRQFANSVAYTCVRNCKNTRK